MTDDETRCDHCGQPTPRLDPPEEVELCNACYDVDLKRQIAVHNAAVRREIQAEAATRYLRAVK